VIEPVCVVGRYALYAEIASGGMATVHFGRLIGPVGFSRTVAIKRLHPQFAKDAEFVTMFLDEARIAARIRHPNVVGTLDVVATESELFLVMDYVQGESLSRLARGRRVPARVAISILCGALHGLHAAHEAKSEQGEPLHIVHRDISPQNILVGVDGIARVLDFGIAKARGRAHTTRDGNIRGKLPYMAPEQFQGSADRRTDIYAMTIVAWEILTGQPLFIGQDEAETMGKVLLRNVPPPSSIAPELPRDLDEVLLRGLSTDPDARYETAREMAMALEERAYFASPSEVGEWVATAAGSALAKRGARIAEIESSSSSLAPDSANLFEEMLSTTGPPSSTGKARRAEGAEPVGEASASFRAALAVTPTPVTSTGPRVNGRLAPPTYPPAPGPWVEPSSVSMIGLMPTPAPSRPASRAWWALSLAALPVIAVLFFVFGSQQRPAPADAAQGAQKASAEPAPPSDTPTSPSAEPIPSAERTPAPVSDPAAVLPGPALSQRTPLATSALRPAPDRKGLPATAPAKPPRSGCDPPYTLDAQGHRRYKVECL
jgi:serine/threonine protein kinase